MNREASFPAHPHAPRRRRHAFARRHDERVSPLVREVVVLLEHGKLDGAKVLTDLGEREPADLDKAEERLAREQAVVLVRVAHVPSATMSDSTGSNTSETLHELRTDSYVRSGAGSTMGRYGAISVETGETVR